MAVTVSLSGYSDNEREFMIAFGRVLAEWSYIETSLFGIFGLVTGLDEEMARSIFYSARSFNGRSDMLREALCIFGKNNANKVVVGAFNEALTKANQYNGFRNALAHNLPIATATEKGAEIVLVENKQMPENYMKNALNEKALVNAYVNFNRLQNLTDLARGYVQHELLERLPELREQLHMLPSVPSRKEPSRNQEGRQRQRQAARPKEAKIPQSE